MVDYQVENKLQIPDHEIESLARTFLPAIREYFESEEGQREFEGWLAKCLVDDKKDG